MYLLLHCTSINHYLPILPDTITALRATIVTMTGDVRLQTMSILTGFLKSLNAPKSKFSRALPQIPLDKLTALPQKRASCPPPQEPTLSPSGLVGWSTPTNQSGTTQVSRYQKGKTNLDFTEARDSDRQWHQLGHM